MTALMNKNVLIEASSDASVLSSVIGSYDDHNFSGSTLFMQQGSSDHSNSSFYSTSLFSTLLHLMEPSHVSLCVCVCVCVCACACVCVCLYTCVCVLSVMNEYCIVGFLRYLKFCESYGFDRFVKFKFLTKNYYYMAFSLVALDHISFSSCPFVKIVMKKLKMRPSQNLSTSKKLTIT